MGIIKKFNRFEKPAPVFKKEGDEIGKMEKLHSPHHIVISMDEDWVYITYLTKAGKIHDQNMIATQDLPTWLNKLKNDGFKLEKEIDPSILRKLAA